MSGNEKPNPWLNGWSDVVSNLNVLPGCIRLVDVRGCATQNLLIADQSLRLVSYKGTNIDWECKLTEKPIHMAYFYPEQGQIMSPIIAVAGSSSIYMFRGMKPYYRLILPRIDMVPEEKEVWLHFSKENFDDFFNNLTKLKAADIDLTYKSLEVLGYQTQEAQMSMAQDHFDEGLDIEDSVTCLDVFKRGSGDEYAIGQVLVGTEQKCFYILSQNGTTIIKSLRLTGTPISITSFQVTEQEYRFCVLLRENTIIFIKNGDFQDQLRIDLDSKPIQMIKQDQSFYVSLMSQSVSCYTYKNGFQKMFLIQFQTSIVCLESLEYGRTKQIKGLLVALQDHTIKLYIDKVLINSIELNFCVSVMKFGVFGREDGFLIIIDEKGGIVTKILQRQFNQQSSVQKQLVQNKAQEEQDAQQITIPKKTKLFIEQAKRERDQGVEIHRSYQFDLMRMRLKTAQVYLGVLEDDGLPAQLSSGVGLRLQAQVEGLGPIFKINCTVENIGNTPMQSVYVSLQYNDSIFKVLQTTYKLGYLIPGIFTQFWIQVQNIDEGGSSDQIKIYLFDDTKTQPIIGAIVQMPISDLIVG